MENRKITVLFILLLQIFTVNAANAQYITPKELNVIVYDDGFLLLNYELMIDETRPSVNVSLPSNQYEYLIVEDENNIPLSYQGSDEILTVDTLSSSYVYIKYQTQEHTSKDGLIWGLRLDVPYICNFLFPDNTVILSFNSAPLSMSQQLDNILLVMPPGFIELGYMFEPRGDRENALDNINRAELWLHELEDQGIITNDVEALVEQAHEAFNVNNYEEADTYATNAILIAEQLKTVALNALAEIQTAKSAINNAKSDHRIYGLEQAEIQLDTAEEVYTQGEYEESMSLARAAILLAEEAITESPENSVIIYLVFGVFVIGLLGGYYVIKKRQPRPQIDIKIIGENGGELFASQLYEKMDIPRTSQWRMLNRLKDYEIISIESVRRQNLIQINKKYVSGNGTK